MLANSGRPLVKRVNLWVVGEHTYNVAPCGARRVLLHEFFELGVLRFQRFDSMFNVGGAHLLDSAIRIVPAPSWRIGVLEMVR